MILLLILAIIAALLTLFTIIVISVGGAIGIIIMADVIVCILFIIWTIKRIIQKRRN